MGSSMEESNDPSISSPVPIGGTMSIWVWILLGIVGFFAVSLLVGLAVAAILANIGREFSELMEFEPLESSPAKDPAELTPKTARRRFVDGQSGGLRL
jgi:hypothetical protein